MEQKSVISTRLGGIENIIFGDLPTPSPLQIVRSVRVAAEHNT